MSRPLIGAFVLAATLLVCTPAMAQLTPSLDLQRFDPAANTHGFVSVEGAHQLPALRPGFDLYFGYAHHLLQRSAGLRRAEPPWEAQPDCELVEHVSGLAQIFLRQRGGLLTRLVVVESAELHAYEARLHGEGEPFVAYAAG